MRILCIFDYTLGVNDVCINTIICYVFLGVNACRNGSFNYSDVENIIYK